MSQHRSPDQQARYSGPPWPVALCAALVVAGLLAAGVVLAEAGWDSGQIIGMLTGFVTVAGGILAALGKLMADHRTLVDKQDDQSATLNQIAWNTNGNLKRLINEAVASALQDQEVRQAKAESTPDTDPKNRAA
jgi:uncharacterized transporter YbjL